jgi:hypothetical protein
VWGLQGVGVGGSTSRLWLCHISWANETVRPSASMSGRYSQSAICTLPRSSKQPQQEKLPGNTTVGGMSGLTYSMSTQHSKHNDFWRWRM